MPGPLPPPPIDTPTASMAFFEMPPPAVNQSLPQDFFLPPSTPCKMSSHVMTLHSLSNELIVFTPYYVAPMINNNNNNASFSTTIHRIPALKDFSFDDDVSNIGSLFDAASLPAPRLETTAAAAPPLPPPRPPPPPPPPLPTTTATASSFLLDHFNQASVDGIISSQSSESADRLKQEDGLLADTWSLSASSFCPIVPPKKSYSTVSLKMKAGSDEPRSGGCCMGPPITATHSRKSTISEASPRGGKQAGGMKGADIAVGWVDSSGKVHIQDRFAFDKTKPIIDNTTQDWFVLQGQEQNGWTAIQFKRYFDSCDPMDVPIKSGTNILIFAYGLVDLDLCQSNVDITYHNDRRGTHLFECTSKDVLNDDHLPDGICDDILTETRICSSRLATAWSIGADVTTVYPEEAGYPITTSVGTKYFMIKMHYDNPRQTSNLRDSSGIRFYLGDELRQYDLGYVLFGTLSSPAALAIPPKTEQFIVDSYCPPEATRNFPVSGINIVSALPHTHLQGT
ncbi:unnamed protein product [Rotaria sp. Silwood1]|nr:unnamed protein product [Rotaria sp. Silwood1]